MDDKLNLIEPNSINTSPLDSGVEGNQSPEADPRQQKLLHDLKKRPLMEEETGLGALLNQKVEGKNVLVAIAVAAFNDLKRQLETVSHERDYYREQFHIVDKELAVAKSNLKMGTLRKAFFGAGGLLAGAGLGALFNQPQTWTMPIAFLLIGLLLMVLALRKE